MPQDNYGKAWDAVFGTAAGLRTHPDMVLWGRLDSIFKMNINRHQVTSSQIKSIGYHPESKTLEIEFKGKGDSTSTYRYDDFPQDKWDEFRTSKSTGSYFYAHVKGKYGFKKQ